MTRKKAFSVILVVLALITLSAVASWCSMSSEWRNVFSEFIFETYYIYYLIYGAVYFGVIFGIVTVAASITWFVFGINSIKRFSIISDDELKFSARFFLILSAATFVMSLIIMIVRAVDLNSSVPFAALFCCWQNPLFAWLFYIRRFKKRG